MAQINKHINKQTNKPTNKQTPATCTISGSHHTYHLYNQWLSPHLPPVQSVALTTPTTCTISGSHHTYHLYNQWLSPHLPPVQSVALTTPTTCTISGSHHTYHLYNQWLSPLKLWVRIRFMVQCELDTTLCDKVCQWLVTGRWFSPDTLLSSTNKTYPRKITEILLRVALNIIKSTNTTVWWVFFILSYK